MLTSSKVTEVASSSRQCKRALLTVKCQEANMLWLCYLSLHINNVRFHRCVDSGRHSWPRTWRGVKVTRWRLLLHRPSTNLADVCSSNTLLQHNSYTAFCMVLFGIFVVGPTYTFEMFNFTDSCRPEKSREVCLDCKKNDWYIKTLPRVIILSRPHYFCNRNIEFVERRIWGCAMHYWLTHWLYGRNILYCY